MRIFGLTRHGPGKEQNEDRLLIGRSLLAEGYYEGELPPDCLPFAIADGVGGRRAGAAASQFVTAALQGMAGRPYAEGEALAETLRGVNRRLLERASRDEALEGMAATLTGIWPCGGRLWLFHVGNTRLYVRQGSYLKQLTVDHTKVGMLLRRGLLGRREAEESDERNVITACMGGGDAALLSALRVEDIAQAVEGSDTLVLTSDGVHEALGERELERIVLADGPERERLSAAVDAAREAGSADDASILLIGGLAG